MKKALIVLLILAVAGGLFADPTFSGHVRTGVKITFDDDPSAAANDGDGDHPVYGELGFTNGGDDWGVKIGANANVGADGAGNGLGLGDLNGWVKFADIFKLTAGKGVGGAWGTGGNTDTNVSSSNAGVRLEITPIDGLNFGFRFGFASDNGKVGPDKIANFLQETGIGVKYDAGIWNVATGLDLDSEESNSKGLDGLWYFGFNFSGISLVNIHVGGKVDNLFGQAGDMTVKLYEKLSGSIAGIDWELAFNESVVPSPITAGLDAGLSYGIPINEKASAEIGADASLTILEKFSFDSWDIYAKLSYNFNGNVSTSAKFEVDGTVEPSKITPFLLWTIKYSF
jgi:hypothetical protein